MWGWLATGIALAEPNKGKREQKECERCRD